VQCLFSLEKHIESVINLIEEIKFQHNERLKAKEDLNKQLNTKENKDESINFVKEFDSFLRNVSNR
jgi:hypothetical protein